MSGPHPPTIVRSYRGNQGESMYAFQRDAAYMAQGGYYPVAQYYVPGSWGAGAFIIAILLILAFGFGLLILVYLVVVKPAGTLTVTYPWQWH